VLLPPPPPQAASVPTIKAVSPHLKSLDFIPFSLVCKTVSATPTGTATLIACHTDLICLVIDCIRFASHNGLDSRPKIYDAGYSAATKRCLM
jgi:hypothetical protein